MNKVQERGIWVGILLLFTNITVAIHTFPKITAPRPTYSPPDAQWRTGSRLKSSLMLILGLQESITEACQIRALRP